MIGRNNKQTNKPSHGVVSNVRTLCLFGHHARLSRNKSCHTLSVWQVEALDAAWWRPSRPRKLVELEQGLYDPSTARPAPRIRYAFRTLGIFVFRCGPSPRPIGRHVQSALGPARLLRQRGASMCNDDAPSARMSRPARRTTPSGKRVGNAPGEVSRRLVAPREGPNPRNRGTAPLGQLVDSLEEALRTPMECGPLESVVWETREWRGIHL